MIWTPEAIVGFAHTAGFRGAVLTDAVAIALASSGGDDALRHLGPAGYQSDTRGLWQIDVARLTGFGKGNLYDPIRNAKAAYRLWNAYEKGWDWNYAYNAGTWQGCLLVASKATKAASRTQPASWLPQGLVDALDASRQVATAEGSVGALLGIQRAFHRLLE